MATTTNAAGQLIEATPVRVVTQPVVTDEIGRAVVSVPIRYVPAVSGDDELGRTVDAWPVEIVTGLTAQTSTLALVATTPVRVVAGNTTTDETGRRVPVRAAYQVGGTPAPTGVTGVAAGGLTPTGSGLSAAAIAATGAGGLSPTGSAAGTVAPSAPFNSIGADGWRANVSAPTDLSLTPFNVARNGFDTNGNAITAASGLITDIRRLTKRVRNVYPNHATLTANDVAVDDYIYAGDVLPGGAVNNSTLVSPKPVVEWVTADRRTVGNSITVEVTAFHREARLGRQVACVEVRATDGTNFTAWQNAGAPIVSNRAGDAAAVIVHRATIDITALANQSVIRVQRRVKPWVGVAASVLGEADVNNPRQTAERIYWKDTAIVAAPVYAYVRDAANGGNDSTGAVSTNAATASAAPFATFAAALTALHTNRGALGVDGCIIRIGLSASGIPLTVAAATRNQRCGALIVERDPAVTQAQALLTMSAATGFRLGGVFASGITTAAIVFRDCTVRRLATAGQFTGGGGLIHEIDLEDMVMDHNGMTTNYIGSNVQRIDMVNVALNGVSGTGAMAGGTGTTGGHRLMRGVVGTAAAGATNIERYCMVGCALDGFQSLGKVGTREDDSGMIVAFNRFTRIPLTADFLVVATAATEQTHTGMAVVQNLFEAIGTNATKSLFDISPDSGLVSTNHMIAHHNTCAGANLAGRTNHFYDEAAGTVRRTHVLASIKGNILARTAIKGDMYWGLSAPVGTTGDAQRAEAPNRTGNFALVHGVGYEGNHQEWGSQSTQSNPNADFRFSYPGRNAAYPNAEDVNQPAGFVARANATYVPPSTYNPGAGGGNYGLNAGADARGRVETLLIGFDLGGVARSGTQPAGALA